MWFIWLFWSTVNARFNISDPTHVMVFMHIQKTGGTTFNRHLIDNIKDKQCKLTGELERKEHWDVRLIQKIRKKK